MSTQYLGEIRLFAGNFAIQGWQFCDGSLLPISQYAALFDLIGTTYGGDGQQTFALPDLRGRVPVHVGSGFPIGQSAGSESVTVVTNQLPVHTHSLSVSGDPANSASPANNVPAASGTVELYKNAAPASAMDAATLQGNGGGGSQPHENRQPFLAVNFIIALEGIFPSQG